MVSGVPCPGWSSFLFILLFIFAIGVTVNQPFLDHPLATNHFLLTKESILALSPCDFTQKSDVTESEAPKSRKRSFFDAFFEERKQRFAQKSKPNINATSVAIPPIIEHCTDVTNQNNQNDSNIPPPMTFEDLLSDGPQRKKRKISDSAKGWHCSVCTFLNDNMGAIQCAICETPRRFTEKIEYHQSDKSIVESVNSSNTSTSIDTSSNLQCDDIPQITEISQIQIDDVSKVNDTNNTTNPKSVTFLTWNVWFNEELALNQRMKAIGEHITKHNADIVCFQEVTPRILDIFKRSQWYLRGGYRTLVLPKFPGGRPIYETFAYFIVIMTKHQFVIDKSTNTVALFPDSDMNRFMIWCPIKIGDDIIYAATTHLESPVGPHETGPGGRKDWYSGERKAQLTRSLGILDDRKMCKNDNVIFGGDMNWRRPSKNGKNENDGDIKKYLNKHWVDCFETLHPNQDGFTYDAKENGMLMGYLRNRLDRILYKTNGCLRLKSCEIIGKEAIPGVTYWKKYRRKKEEHQKKLPVLPSDHFGLCAKFEFKHES